MRTRKHQYSFAGGEVSPEFYGRGDAAKFQTGLRAARNVVLKPQGSARTRPGAELVNRCWDQQGASQVFPFIYDLDQAYAVELGNSAIRFHANGGTLKWATPRNVGELGTSATLDLVSDPDGILICEEPHGLVDQDVVRVTVTPGGNLPGGLASFVDFEVEAIDTRRLKFYLVGNFPATPETLGPSLGDGYMRVFKTSELPRTYVDAKQFVPGDINGGTGEITVGNHEYQVNDTVRFGTTGTEPTMTIFFGGGPLPAGVDLYVVATTATTVSLGLTLGGSPITYSATGTGTHNIAYRYLHGDLAFVPVNGGSVADAGQVIYCLRDNDSDFLYPNTIGDWNVQTGDGVFTVPSPYTRDQVFDINWDQSGDVVTLVHPEHPERELRRLSALRWVLVDLAFGPSLAAPSVAVARNFGETLKITFYENNGAGRAVFFNNNLDPGVGIGTALLCVVNAAGPPTATNSTYIVNEVSAATGVALKFGLRDVAGNVLTTAAAANTPTTIEFAFTDLISDTNEYVVAAVDADGVETLSASSGAIINNLANPGASNVLTITGVTGAAKYRVYKKATGTGLFGYIGETETLNFTDSDIAPDLTQTPPTADADISNAANYSRATARFEQRRLFAGSDLFPRRLFMSRNGTETDFSSRFPVVDDDRISVEIAAREAHVIRHIVPLGDLILLSQLGEWRVFAINSDAITPSTIAVRPQSYVGASGVRPQVINNSVIYCAARGGHVREMGFQATQQGFVTGDLSLRAAHLFDDYEIKSCAYQKAPVPIVWFTSTSGRLLGLTYVPEERVGAWHRHDTAGSFHAVCSIPDGDEDRVYVSTQRTVNGAAVYNIERLSKLNFDNVLDTNSLDDSQRYNGTGTGTLTISGGGAFAGEEVTVTSSEVVAFSIFDVGKRIYIGASDLPVEITAFVTRNSVTAKLVKDLPPGNRNTALSPWAFGVKTIGGLSLLEGETVSVVRGNSSDGLVSVDQNLVVTNGTVTLSGWATVADVGRTYIPEMRLLPVTLQMEALGYGRDKVVNRAFLRTYEAFGLAVGADDEDTVFNVPDLHVPGGLVTKETRALVSADRTADASLLIRQTLPLPATIVSATIEVSVGE